MASRRLTGSDDAAPCFTSTPMGDLIVVSLAQRGVGCSSAIQRVAVFSDLLSASGMSKTTDISFANGDTRSSVPTANRRYVRVLKIFDLLCYACYAIGVTEGSATT